MRVGVGREGPKPRDRGRGGEMMLKKLENHGP